MDGFFAVKLCSLRSGQNCLSPGALLLKPSKASPTRDGKRGMAHPGGPQWSTRLDFTAIVASCHRSRRHGDSVQWLPAMSIGGQHKFNDATKKQPALSANSMVLTCSNHVYSKQLTYGPRKAVAEVSNHNEPIGRKSGIQLVRKIRKSMDFTFSCFVLNWLTN